MADDFNYDGSYPSDEEDRPLDENGLPSDIITDEETPEELEEQEGIGEKVQNAKDKVENAKDTANKIKDIASGKGKVTDLIGGGGGKDSPVSKAKAAKQKLEAAKKKLEAARKAITNVLSKIPPQVWAVIGIALLVIILIVVLITVISSVVSYFEQKTDPANMTSNSYITSEYFYGTRSVYIDNDALLNSLQLSYKQYSIDVVENIIESYPEITINIVLPEFDEGEVLTNETEIDTHITNMSLGIGNIVATGSSLYDNVDFETLYEQIAYFGLTSAQGELVNDFLTSYLAPLSTLPQGKTMETLVDEAMSLSEMQYIYNLCEKVMIKDEIATESGLTGIEQRNYIASIYMPNKDITISNLSYAISTDATEYTNNYKLIKLNGGTETIHAQEEITDSTHIATGIGALAELTVGQFTSIDTNNPNSYSSGLSLFDAMRLMPEGAQFFGQQSITIGENQTLNVYTWKPVDAYILYLSFEASDKFIFNEFNLDIK